MTDATVIAEGKNSAELLQLSKELHERATKAATDELVVAAQKFAPGVERITIDSVGFAKPGEREFEVIYIEHMNMTQALEAITAINDAVPAAAFELVFDRIGDVENDGVRLYVSGDRTGEVEASPVYYD